MDHGPWPDSLVLLLFLREHIVTTQGESGHPFTRVNGGSDLLCVFIRYFGWHVKKIADTASQQLWCQYLFVNR